MHATVSLPAWLIDFTGFVHSFNLSSFFIVAGFFAWRSVGYSTDTVISSLARKLAWPMILWSIIQSTLYSFAGSSVQNPKPLDDAIFSAIIEPHKHLSFLLSIIVGRLIFLGWRRAGGQKLNLLAMATVYVALTELFWGDPLFLPVLGRIPAYGLFLMVLGSIVADHQELFYRLNRVPTSGLIVTLLTALTLCVGFYAQTSVYASQSGLLIFRLAAILAVFAAGHLLLLTPAKPVVQLLGRNSIEIFLAHLIITGGVRVVGLNVLGERWALPLAFFALLAGIVIPLLAGRVLGRSWIFELPRFWAGWRAETVRSS
jgi:fucose 4-O-acetylase-like acetyltransferase